MPIQAPRTETTVAKPAICRRANERPLWRNDATRLNDRNGRGPDRAGLSGVGRSGMAALEWLTATSRSSLIGIATGHPEGLFEDRFGGRKGAERAAQRREDRAAFGAQCVQDTPPVLLSPSERRRATCPCHHRPPARAQGGTGRSSIEVARNTVTDTVPSPKLLCRAATELCAIRRSLSQKEPRARCQAATVRR